MMLLFMITIAERQKLNLLFGRRSVRVYSPGIIDDQTVTLLLEAAMAAPSAMTKDPWRFVIVREPRRLQQLAGALPGGKMLATAALAVAVCGDIDAAFDRKLSFLLQDCAAATENLLLAAHAFGLGGCWIGVHPDEDAVRRLKQELTLPAAFIPVAVVSLGHPGEDLPPRTRFNPDRIRLENW
jgi:nitroreductase